MTTILSTDSSTAPNSTYPKSGGSVVKAFRKLSGLCYSQSLCLLDSEVLGNRHFRVVAKHYVQHLRRQTC